MPFVDIENTKLTPEDVAEGEVEEIIKVPKVIAWRRLKLWVRQKTTKVGTIVEVRVLNLDGTTARALGKAYMLDIANDKKQVVAALKKGFKCCMCNKNYRILTDYTLVESKVEFPVYEGFNILCGCCWSGKKGLSPKKGVEILTPE